MKGSTAKTNKRSIDLMKLLASYTSGWVAVSADHSRVLASAPTLKEVIDRSLDHFEPNAVYIKVIPPEEGYVSLGS